MADQARTIRIPVHMVEQVNRMVRVRRDLAASLGHEPTIAEVAAALGVTRLPGARAHLVRPGAGSLDQASARTARARWVTRARVRPSEEPGDAVSNGLLRSEVEIVLATLSAR